jgi:hypothetical protein
MTQYVSASKPTSFGGAHKLPAAHDPATGAPSVPQRPALCVHGAAMPPAAGRGVHVPAVGMGAANVAESAVAFPGPPPFWLHAAVPNSVHVAPTATVAQGFPQLMSEKTIAAGDEHVTSGASQLHAHVAGAALGFA